MKAAILGLSERFWRAIRPYFDASDETGWAASDPEAHRKKSP